MKQNMYNCAVDNDNLGMTTKNLKIWRRTRQELEDYTENYNS
jgi:hypothetical protein